jgi:hypothetical protein
MGPIMKNGRSQTNDLPAECKRCGFENFEWRVSHDD